MKRIRVIPVLLLSNSRIVKTIQFKNARYIGDPINIVRIFNDKEVDELMVLDIDCSKKNIRPNFELIEKIAGECFMPLSYGGGIRTLDDAKKIIRTGVGKNCTQYFSISKSKSNQRNIRCFRKPKCNHIY